VEGRPLYAERFDEVLPFHAPGIAPVRRGGEAWHIDTSGLPIYSRRFLRTFGFYERRAVVVSAEGWHHILPDGEDLYSERYAWCGNYQGARCTVRDSKGLYRHLDGDGRPAYPRAWRYAGDYREGFAVVQDSDGRSTHIDAAGQVLHGRWFQDLDVFHKGFARAREPAGWMHIDRTGQPAYPRRFAMAEPFYNGQARVERTDGALEVIDEQGRTQVLLRAPPQLILESPLKVGEFTVEVDSVLARSAWGTVRLARDAMGRQVVAKTNRGGHARELEALSVLAEHPHVPGVLGHVEVEGGGWLFLEYRPGRVLGARNRCEPMSPQAALTLVISVLDVCARLHDVGFAHTDIHPENVLATKGHGPMEVTVLDFAQAVRLGPEGAWRGEVNWGRWEFVPPEQLRDFTVLWASADVYSAAVLLAYLIRGRGPFHVDVRGLRAAGGWDAVRAAFLAARANPDLGGIQPRLASLLRQALSMQPEHRPEARAFMHQLREELSHDA
jgi:hypothetical protein